MHGESTACTGHSIADSKLCDLRSNAYYFSSAAIAQRNRLIEASANGVNRAQDPIASCLGHQISHEIWTKSRFAQEPSLRELQNHALCSGGDHGRTVAH